MPLLTPGQCRAARGFLDLEAEDLADLAGVSYGALDDFEMGRPTDSTVMSRLGEVLRGAGIDFLDADDGYGPGVRLAHGTSHSEGLAPAELNAANDD